MVVKYKPDTEYFTHEGCYITELFNKEDDPNCSIARARVKPGETTEWHALRGAVEFYVILEGEGEVEMDTKAPQYVRHLDVVRIAQEIPQRITNIGDTDLIFLCIVSPRFTPDCYEILES
jgi:quercetin dioxygenase-like cupin family protein